jgi:hypothetical protein
LNRPRITQGHLGLASVDEAEAFARRIAADRRGANRSSSRTGRVAPSIGARPALLCALKSLNLPRSSPN